MYARASSSSSYPCKIFSAGPFSRGKTTKGKSSTDDQLCTAVYMHKSRFRMSVQVLLVQVNAYTVLCVSPKWNPVNSKNRIFEKAKWKKKTPLFHPGSLFFSYYSFRFLRQRTEILRYIFSRDISFFLPVRNKQDFSMYIYIYNQTTCSFRSCLHNTHFNALYLYFITNKNTHF